MARFFSSSRLLRSRDSSSVDLLTSHISARSEIYHSSPTDSETSSIISYRDGSSTPRRDHLGSDANNLDEQLASRLRALEMSLRNPKLSAATRLFLEVAIVSMEKTAAENSEALPPYTEDCRPPYEE